MEKSPHYRFTVYSHLLSHKYYKIKWQIRGCLMCLDLKAYKLTSTSMLRKYSSILDVPFSYITSNIRFVSGWRHIWTAQVHVTGCHTLVWESFYNVAIYLVTDYQFENHNPVIHKCLILCNKMCSVSGHSHNVTEMLHSTVVLLCYSHIC